MKKATDVITGIAAASQEQATGIEQVDQAVTRMDQATQKNTAIIEEAAASAADMNRQAPSLIDLVGFFRLAGQGPALRTVR